MALVGAVFFFVGFTINARMRGRLARFGLLAFGRELILLSVLPLYCLECNGKIKAKQCKVCCALGPP